MKSEKPFRGLKVLDFANSMVGPVAAYYLTLFGATTIRIESSHRLDVVRVSGPFKDGFSHPDFAATIELFNAGKRAITLNLKHPAGVEIAWRLIDWCDVIVESFSPGVMANLGIDYESVRKVKPDVIYMSTSAQGQRGPRASWKGYGNLLSGAAGLYHLMGWPDRDPAGLYMAYNDSVSGRFAALALVAAVARWQKSGRGQYIDHSQLESGVLMLAPVIVDYHVNRRIQTRNGNRVHNAAPHGAYRCRGEERWIAISVRTDDEWQSFKQAIGGSAWSSDPRFSTLAGRKENEDELDRMVEEWTIAQVAEEAMERLQEARVPAGVVWNPKDILDDPNLKARGHFVVQQGHPHIGQMAFPGPQPRMSMTVPEVGRFYGPMGYDNEYVYKEILGMSDDEISECIADGVFE